MALKNFVTLIFWMHIGLLTGIDQEQPKDEEIKFDKPIIVHHSLSSGQDVTLEGFKVETTDAKKIYSFGFPTIANTSNNVMFRFTNEYATVYIKTLDNAQKQTLVEAANHEYHNSTHPFEIRNVFLLKKITFVCEIEYHIDGKDYKLKGYIYDFNKIPFELKFPLKNGSRSAFEKRAALVKKELLLLECELTAANKQNEPNYLRITTEQLQTKGIAEILLGSADGKYVLREQLVKLSQEIEVRLNLSEKYELEDFSEEFVKKVLEKQPLEDVSMDQVLEHMSLFNIPEDQHHLNSSLILKELEHWFVVRNSGKGKYISVNDLDPVQGDTDPSNGNDNSPVEIYVKKALGIQIQIVFVRSKVEEWAANPSSLEDQIEEINNQAGSIVKFELSREIVVPITLNVVKVSQTMINQETNFPNMKRKHPVAQYRKKYTINTERDIQNTDLIRYVIVTVSFVNLQDSGDYVLCIETKSNETISAKFHRTKLDCAVNKKMQIIEVVPDNDNSCKPDCFHTNVCLQDYRHFEDLKRPKHFLCLPVKQEQPKED